MKIIYFPFILSFILMFVSCDLILSGSYPHAQQYECYVTSNELIGKIQDLKKERVNLEVWIKNDSDSIVKMDSYNERFEYLNFKIPITKDSSIIMYSVIFHHSNPAIILLDRISPLNYRTFKHINTKDFTNEENEKMKKIFEKDILDRLSIKWKRK